MRTVEEPLRDVIARGTRDGEETVKCRKITIVTNGDESVHIDVSSCPWYLGEPDEQALRMYKEGLIEANRRGLMHAQFDQANKSGVITGTAGEKVMLVKLNDSCTHDSQGWKETDCGHVFCPMCDGHLDPMTRIALNGARTNYQVQ